MVIDALHEFLVKCLHFREDRLKTDYRKGPVNNMHYKAESNNGKKRFLETFNIIS